MPGLGFPVWIRATHWINVLFLGLLVRAGLQIFGAYPRLYWNDHCTPGTEWFKATKKRIPKDKPWISLEQEENVPSWLGQPGGNRLGLGRHWHFFGAIFWILNGAVYVVLLFATDEWHRLIPSSWQVFPDAWDTLVTYVTFGQPPASAFHPFDPLQQLVYGAVVFLLAPFLILTGMAQSPAIEAHFPAYPKLFGGRQGARSLHFIGLVAFVLFTVIHTAMVIYTGLGKNLGNIILGHPNGDTTTAIVVAVLVIIAILCIYAATSWFSIRNPRRTQRWLHSIIGPPMRTLSLHASSRQHYTESEISPYLILNGYPPHTRTYQELEGGKFSDWRLEINGLVEHPLELSMAGLREMPSQTQVTKHHCIQGWCGIASWTGVPVAAILERCQPLPAARYAVFYSHQEDESGRLFYGTIDLRLAKHYQTLLAYEMNGLPLTIEHGAPLRLRVETELGFKMVKWLKAIEFVEDFRSIGAGQGGSREDNMYYEQSVSI